MSNPFEIGDFLKEKKISSVKDGTLSKMKNFPSKLESVN